jgi:hypothetical protein
MRRSPFVWAVLYLLLVPVFATAYAALPARSFRDSNIEAEAPLATDAAGLRDALTTSVSPRVTPMSWTSPLGKLRVDPASVRVASIRHTNGGRILIELSGEYASVEGQVPAMFGTFREWVEVFIEGQLVTRELPHPAEVSYSVALVNPDGGAPVHLPFNPPVSLLMATQAGARSAPSDSGALTLSLDANRRLVRFYNAVEGDPSDASGWWMRMLYFSSTTITTLGLGDLTPVSATARELVGLEALAGIVVIGLFLNALASGIRSGRRAEDHDQPDEPNPARSLTKPEQLTAGER